MNLKLINYYSRVSSHVLALLASNGTSPAGLFLESPFNNLADEISEHPLSQVCKSTYLFLCGLKILKYLLISLKFFIFIKAF